MSRFTNSIAVTSTALALSVVASSASTQTVEPTPQIIAADDGIKGVGENGFIASIKVGSVSSGASQLYLGTGIVPPGTGTGRHLHEVDEEILYVLDGEVSLVLNDETHTLRTGDTAFIPPGTWMELTNRSDKPARMLGVLGRGEVERCFRAIYPAEGAFKTVEDRRKEFAFCKTRLAEDESG